MLIAYEEIKTAGSTRIQFTRETVERTTFLHHCSKECEISRSLITNGGSVTSAAPSVLFLFKVKKNVLKNSDKTFKAEKAFFMILLSSTLDG